jgi:hypothetical protein
MRLWPSRRRRDTAGVLGLAHRVRVRLAAPPALRALADAAAPVAAAAIGLGRLVGLVAAGAPVDRLALCLVLWAFLVALVLSALRPRTAYPGELAIAFVAIHELGRGWLEFLRTPGPEPVGQALAFVAAAVAGVALVAGRR